MHSLQDNQDNGISTILFSIFGFTNIENNTKKVKLNYIFHSLYVRTYVLDRTREVNISSIQRERHAADSEIQRDDGDAE